MKSLINSKQDIAHGCAGVARGRTPNATVRDYAAKEGIGVEVVMEEGMKAKAAEFKEQGSEIYTKA